MNKNIRHLWAGHVWTDDVITCGHMITLGTGTYPTEFNSFVNIFIHFQTKSKLVIKMDGLRHLWTCDVIMDLKIEILTHDYPI